MIDTKDIRLGNLVLDKHGKVSRVIEIGQTGIKIEGGPGSYRQYAGDFSPIPLTGEWLIRLGFYESEDNFIGDHEYDLIWSNSYIELVKIEDSYREVERCDDRYFEGVGHIKIMYVHQLQNIHYIQNEEELKSSEEHFNHD